MKTYILSFAFALLCFGFISCDKTMSANATACCEKSDCCKNCDDEECKTTCTKVSQLSEAEKSTEEGKALMTKCADLCKKNECCDKDAKSCDADGKKSCCSDHKKK